MFAVVFKLSAYKLSERLRPATVADVSEGKHCVRAVSAGLPWVCGSSWGFPWVWVWAGYGDRNSVPTAALCFGHRERKCAENYNK